MNHEWVHRTTSKANYHWQCKRCGLKATRARSGMNVEPHMFDIERQWRKFTCDEIQVMQVMES